MPAWLTLIEQDIGVFLAGRYSSQGLASGFRVLISPPSCTNQPFTGTYPDLAAVLHLGALCRA